MRSSDLEKAALQRDVQGRYLDSEGRAYERVSTLINRWSPPKTNLERWRERHVARGAGRRPDIAQLAACLDIKTDRDELHGIIDDLMQVSESDVAANLGTAVHAAHEHHSQGFRPDWARPYTEAIAACLDELCLDVVAHEQVVFHPLGFAGTIDDILISAKPSANNQALVGDLKTGSSVDRRHIITQLSMYAAALDSSTSDQTSVCRTHGLLVHIPVCDSGELMKNTQIVAKRVELIEDIVAIPWLSKDQFKSKQIEVIYKKKVEA